MSNYNHHHHHHHQQQQQPHHNINATQRCPTAQTQPQPPPPLHHQHQHQQHHLQQQQPSLVSAGIGAAPANAINTNTNTITTTTTNAVTTNINNSLIAGHAVNSSTTTILVAPPPQPLISNSLAIRQEIQRFESVHPSIYAIYDLIDLLPLPDAQIAQQIRDHVVCIEDSFVNSQEWTISRSVPDLRLGIVGSLSSGKSALVHRYLTGSYMQEESPEGGRFKKEVFIDGQSYLLLIRDEGGPPEMQFAGWVDAVIFVFSLENESSFNTIYNYYTKMANFRNGQEVPMILVGTQDAISERNPRVIDDSRARKLASDLKRCSYYETCATYGLNVERVFQDACQKILSQRLPLPPPTTQTRPTTPQGSRLSVATYHERTSGTNTNHNQSAAANGYANTTSISGGGVGAGNSNLTLPGRHHALSTSSHHIPMRMSADFVNAEQTLWAMQHGQQGGVLNENNNITKYNPQAQAAAVAAALPPPAPVSSSSAAAQMASDSSLSTVQLRDPRDLAPPPGHKELPTPTSTPTTSRKSRRRSNLFIPSSSKKGEKDQKANGELGSGRSIPIKQGYLYKRSSKSLNKEWKKKYVTLCNDGRLTYHPSLHDYMDDVHGKEIPLQYVTVKVPGQKPRGSKSIITNSALTTSLLTNGKVGGGGQHHHFQHNGLTESVACLTLSKTDNQKKLTEKLSLTAAFDSLRGPGNNSSGMAGVEPLKSNSSQQTSGDEGIAMSNSNSQTFIAGGDNMQREQLLPSSLMSNNKLDAQTPNVKKRHRRIKSSSVKSNDVDDNDGYEFYIVSLDSKQWHFEAANSEERDEWVAAIEQEIFKSLQGIESTKTKPATTTELAAMVAIRTRVPGNGFCADCTATNPEWASLNLGILMCIECSGIHRNLGSHISKVRSLGLDDWSAPQLSVMLAIGNSLANSIWEAHTRQRIKPSPNSSREEKESWVRSKYEAKEFLAQCNPHSNATSGQQLIEAVIKADIKTIVAILANSSSEVTNANVNARDVRTPLLLACAIGNLAIAQLLIWNGANLKHTDHEGRTCLAYARAAQSLATAKSVKAAAVAAASAAAAATNSSSASNTSNSSASTVGAAPSVATTAATNGGIPAPQYNVEDTTALVELLVSLGCPESAPLTASGTLPRRRDTLGTPYEKSVSGVI